MNKVRLILRSVTEILGNDEIGLLILADEQCTRQLAVPCDRNMLYQFQLRMQHVPITNLLLPEMLWQIVRSETNAEFEVLIHDLINGLYRSMLLNTATLEPYTMRISDALLLAYVADIPIYIRDSLMRKQSIPFCKNTPGMSIPVNTLTDSMLTNALDRAIKDENYELASYLRDEMKRRHLHDTNNEK